MGKPLLCKYPFRAIAIKSYSNSGKLKSLWPCCMMGNQTLREINEGTYNNNKLGIEEDLSDLTPQELFDHPRMQQLRDNLKNGVRDPACEICWEQEDRGIISFREHSFHPNDSVEEIVANPQLKIIDMSLGNVCNLRCRMCAPSSSNLLMIDYNYFIKNNLEKDVQYAISRWSDSKSYSFNLDEVSQWKWINDNTDKISKLRLSGGEPFYSDKVISFLDKCIADGKSEKITLEFHTNGTLFDDELAKKLSKFKNGLNFSIDGSDRVFEYIRYPATWTQLENSFRTYLKYVPVDILNISVVMMITNIFNIPDFMRWLHKFGIFISMNFAEVHTADRGVALYHLSIDLLKEAALEIKMASDSTGIECDNALRIIEDAIKNNKENKEKTKLELQLFDKVRSQYYGDYIDARVVKWLES